MRFSKVFGLVGLLMAYLGGALLLPFFVSLYYRESSAWWVLLTALLSASLGLGLFKWGRLTKRASLSLKDSYGAVAFSWFSAILIAALPFYLSGAIPDYCGALFEAASGLTTTGATIVKDFDAMPRGLLFLRSYLHWIGGMGILVLAVAIAPYMGMGSLALNKNDLLGTPKEQIAPRVFNTVRVLGGIYLSLTICCFSMLVFSGMSWYDGICHAFAAIATGGFSTQALSIAQFRSNSIEYILVFFMFLSGISYVTHYRALNRTPFVYLRSLEVRIYAGLILVVTAVLYLTRLNERLPLEQNLRECLFQVVSMITTTGLRTSEWDSWRPFAHYLILGLMLVGACSGSTGGGIKVLRLILIAKSLKVSLNQQLHPSGVFVMKMDGQLISRDTVKNILGFCLVYFIVLTFATFLLCFFGMEIVEAFSSALSCLSNVGPGMGAVGPAQGYAGEPSSVLWTLMCCMLMGRLEFFALLVLLVPQTWHK